MNKKSVYLKVVAALVTTTFLYGCSSKGGTQTETSTQTETTAQAKASIIGDKNVGSIISQLVTYEKEESYSDWKNENPNYIELSGTTANLKGSGAEVKASKITITAAGVYVVSGKLDNGQIIVDVKDKGTVKIVLNGTEIKSSDNAPIYVKNAGKTILSIEAGTENSITDGEKYTLEDASSDEPSAAIFSKDNLVINGTGKLTVKANYKDGIASKDDLKIVEGNIYVIAVDDGIVGRDILAVKEGSINIEAGGDAVKSSNDEAADKGIVAIENGTFNLKSKNDGIQAETAVLITNGSFNIISGGGSVNGTKKAEEGMRGPMDSGKNTNSTNTATSAQTESESAKAIKAGADVGVAGGTFNIDSADDSIHSNNNVTIEGGSFNITSGDDGIHGDSTIFAKGGKINITKSYEGIESSIITISDGEIYVTASDDGLNAGGGADGSSVNGRPGQNNFNSSSSNKLNINGGYIVINSVGDSLDANGSIYMTKGTVIVSGPTANYNGALDYDGTFEMTGGYLVSAGSSGMAQAPSDTSAQNSIIMTYPKAQAAGTIVNLQDGKGNAIVTFAPGKEYQTVVISSPQLKKGENYTLYSGGKSTGTSKDGLYIDGKYEGGTKVVSFAISNSTTWLNESGVTTAKSGMQGGPGGKGGFRGEGGQKGERPSAPPSGQQPQQPPAQQQ
ncbi:carbohydrate-binding domain-containing protein [Clostridium swellfunianum]|uniref:carbohydrate-binding domain-containing protein n=1 Tax=Clostridium swellfunianum TaxID=1367462 RepID=UPI00202DE652|nr:carbohydrate-binding domain-containing protein [Clostridium swellfunianum]MCM0648035.1 carbohydrate-binding domain-containing protein [Clostridium swellfunianum]